MSERSLRAVTIGFVALLLFALAGPASAQDREFNGKIVKVDHKRVVVDNRMGEGVRFQRTKATRVSDRRPPRMRHSPREEWGHLRKGDWVAVEWSLADKPRKAYRIVVLPPRTESERDD